MKSLSSLLPLLLTAAATGAAALAPATPLTLQIGVPSFVQEQHKEPATVTLLSTIPSWTRATLESGDGRQFVSAPITADGRLIFANVTAGSYLGEVHCATHVFGPLRVDVEEEKGPAADAAADAATNLLVTRVTETYRGNDWANQGEVLQRVLPGNRASSSPLAPAVIGPTFLVAPLSMGTKSYYAERSKFNVLSLLKNPMILLALVAMGVMFGIPMLLDQMDPETRAEFEERQKANPVNSLLGGGGGGPSSPSGGSFDMAAYLAGSGKGDKKQGGGSARK
ncbi:hypothetical protein SEPCBS119000_004745 [Sporothrix epigloea]|uniref:ER membrane protein complex subunit 7 beta-sandwich domain-containing protein n=1 Tax=Sporothrix epigloea TaxID=1892477 RepID=A0ABP0DXK6_9PEZI